MTPTERPQDGLRSAKRQFFIAAAKFLAVLSTALVPALVGWIDSSSQADIALTATATEQAVSEAAYAEQAAEIVALRERQAVLEDRIDRLANRTIPRTLRRAPSTPEAASAKRPAPTLTSPDVLFRRPKATTNAVQQIKQLYLE